MNNQYRTAHPYKKVTVIVEDPETTTTYTVEQTESVVFDPIYAEPECDLITMMAHLPPRLLAVQLTLQHPKSEKDGTVVRMVKTKKDVPPEQCTGLGASWCPIHGDCSCDREESMDSWDCPLHGLDSTHAHKEI